MAKKYKVGLTPSAQRTYNGLSKPQKKTVDKALDYISAHPGTGTNKHGSYVYSTSTVMIEYVIDQGRVFISIIRIIAL